MTKTNNNSTALGVRDRIASGALTVTELAAALIAHIEKRDLEIRAWAWFDRDFVLDQAKALDKTLDKARAAGDPVGRLFGLPIGIKDVIDTADIPTENGSRLDVGRVPQTDAALVARLKAEGAVIMGKTTTTELAFLDPTDTRNPLNPAHTPGGSSAGSAAAVAARMVPLAIGTQTAGSVIRPASFCGVVGFKPSFGLISRAGVLSQSPNLDTIGVFARSVEDVALLAEALAGYDPNDPATRPAPVPKLLDAVRDQTDAAPKFAFVRQPAWSEAEEQTRSAFAKLAVRLGDRVEEVPLGDDFATAWRAQAIIQKVELAKSCASYFERDAERISPRLLEAIAEGAAVSARDYLTARDWQARLPKMLEPIFARFDAILTPAAAGPAPKGFGSTGSPAFNGLWTMAGTPAVTVPLQTTANGLSIGAQLVGRRGEDARLLRNAVWLQKLLARAKAGA